MYNEIFIQDTKTYLHSDPVTCVGCAAFGISSKWCRELRHVNVCQKQISIHMLDVIVRLVEDGHLVLREEVK